MKRPILLLSGTALLAGLACMALYLQSDSRGREPGSAPVAPSPRSLETRSEEISRARNLISKQADALDPALTGALDRKDWEAAASALWSLAISGDEDRRTRALDMLRGVVVEWLSHDAAKALAWVQALPPGPAQAEILGQVSYEIRTEAGALASEDPQKAADWLRTLPSGEAAARAAASVAKAWAAKDPLAAASYASNLSLEGARNQAASAVASTWGSQDPREAALWAGGLPEGAMRENAMKGLITAWTFLGDPNEAAQWLEQQPQTRSLDVAVDTFSAAVAPKDPEAAFQWASTIADETLRNGQLTEVARTWLVLAPEAARTHIIQSSLPQEIKNQLLTSVTP